MSVWSLGSVNADLVYRVPHLPAPGETLAAGSMTRGLGGKGANMSVAIARAGSRVELIGAVGPDGTWMRDRLAAYGVGVRHLTEVAEESGHAVIYVDSSGENQIVIYPGANRAIDADYVEQTLQQAARGDTAIFQNETSAQAAFARAARHRGLRVAYAAAPFSAEAVAEVLDLLDLLVLNSVEAAQLESALGRTIETLPVADIVVTLGADGCRWIGNRAGTSCEFPAEKVEVKDTTGAGDTFTGYLVAALDQELAMPAAIELAQKAAAVMVTRHGTADVIPTRDDLA